MFVEKEERLQVIEEGELAVEVEEEEEEEEEEAVLLGKFALPHKWSNKKVGSYQVQTLEDSWTTIWEANSFLDQVFEEFYLLCFLDHGGILLKALKEDTQEDTLLICDLFPRLCTEVETDGIIGTTHASEYVEDRDSFSDLPSCNSPDRNQGSGPSTPESSNTSGSIASQNSDPDEEMTGQMIGDVDV